MDEATTSAIIRAKEVLVRVGMGISQARVALSEAKDELSDLFDRLERAEAVSIFQTKITEDRVLSQMRQKEHDAHPGG